MGSLKYQDRFLQSMFPSKHTFFPKAVLPLAELPLCFPPTSWELLLPLPHLTLWSRWWGRRQPLVSPAFSWQVASLLQPSVRCTAASPSFPSLMLVTHILNPDPRALDVIVRWLVGAERRHSFQAPARLNPCVSGGLPCSPTRQETAP